MLAPHPDDESIGMGGTLALYPQQLDVVCLSSGQEVKHPFSSHLEENIRKVELKNALSLSGIETFHCLEIPDQEILTHYARFKTLDFSDADLIFLPNLLDQHPDHKAVAWLLFRYFKDFPNKIKPTLQIAFYEVWNALALPNAFVDVSAVAETKRSMINAHASQVASKAYAEKILGLNAYRGLLKNVEYAEAFSVVDLSTFEMIMSTMTYDS